MLMFMCIEGKHLGLPGNGKVDIMNVKCDPEMVSLLTQTYGLLPGYHMNKSTGSVFYWMIPWEKPGYLTFWI